MNPQKKPTKPDIAASSAYTLIANTVLKELHSNALKLLKNELSAKSDLKSLMIVGPGSDVLPFSNEIEYILETIGTEGNLILLDYNSDICNNAKIRLTKNSFFDVYSDSNTVLSENEVFDPLNHRGFIHIQNHNIKQGFYVPDNSVSAIDLTVAVHHITQYEQDLEKVLRQAFQVLQPGGALHLGEGNVDMKHSEKKIINIVNTLYDAGEKKIFLSDERYQDSPSRVQKIGEQSRQKTSAHVRVTQKAMVHIRYSENITDIKIINAFENAGYKSITNTGDQVIFPLIDHGIESDFKGLVVPVREYYQRIVDCFEDDPKYAQCIHAIQKEQSDAERGIVEYYSHPDMIVKNLKKVGFKIKEKITQILVLL